MKMCAKCGKTDKDALYMPKNDEGKTLGFCFITFVDYSSAKKALRLLDGTKFGSKNTMKVFKYTDFDQYKDLPEEFDEDALKNEKYTPRPNYLEWLLDGREQFVARQGKETTLSWVEGPSRDAEEEKLEIEPKKGTWTNRYVQFSPQGSFLATLHGPGAKLWGGEKFGEIPNGKVGVLDIRLLLCFTNSLYSSPMSE